MSENLVYLDDQNFKGEVLEYNGVMLVDFYADWCRPCKMIAPIVEELASENSGKVKVAKLNVENARIASNSFRVMSIPTLVIFKNGQEVDRIIGFQHKSEIQARINSVL